MVDAKKIGIAGAAVVLVTLVTIFSTSYMADFENVRNSSQEKFETSSIQPPPMLGSPTASVTIIEVGDYQCEMCKLWFEKTRPLIIEKYIETGKANFVFIDMPFLGNDSLPAAAATYCANDQGKYWEYHSQLYILQQHVDDGWANTDRLSAIAFNLNLNLDEFNECMSSNKHYSTVSFNKETAKNNFGANSTPTFVIASTSGDSVKITGAHPITTFDQIITPML